MADDRWGTVGQFDSVQGDRQHDESMMKDGGYFVV
jgi:hypothetical protein